MAVIQPGAHRTNPAERAKRYRQKIRSNDRWTLLLLSPVFTVLILVIFLPEVWALWISFTNYRLGDSPRFIGTSNFEYFLTDPDFWNALWVNVKFVIGAVTIQMLVGLGIALYLARLKSRLKFLWIALVLAPMAVSPAVSSVIWKYLFDANIGPVNWLIEQMGFERVQWLTGLHWAMVSVIIVEVWMAIPHVVLFLYPARITFPEDLYEAAEIDGATPWQRFRHITMPLLKPAFLLCLVFRVIITIRAFGVVWLLTKGGPNKSTELLAIYMFKEGFENWRFGSAAAIAWAMLIITMLLSSYMIYQMYQNAFVRQRRV